jgi:nicotinate-nucleotide adenylyltransferase
MTTPLRIGIFGGSFNPIHRCHLAIARETRRRVSLDRVVFVPTGDPPHKPMESLAEARHRLEMVRLAVQQDPGFSVSDVEAVRSAKSYSIETIHRFRSEHGSDAELFFIIGLDAFLEVGDWKQASDVLQAVHFIVVNRSGLAFSRLRGLGFLPAIDASELVRLQEGAIQRLDVPLTSRTGLILLRLPPCEVSASDIRARVRRGESIANLLPGPVESYILHHELYREHANRSGSKS